MTERVRPGLFSRVMLGIILVFGCIGLGLFYVSGYSRHYFRLDFEFEVDGRKMTASSVYRVTTYDILSPIPGGTALALSGDAKYIDLSPHGHVMALLDTYGIGNLPRDLVVPINQRKHVAKEYAPLRRMIGFRATVPRSKWPQLAIFEGGRELKDALFVTPEDLTQRTGGSVVLREVILEIVAGPETRSIEEILPDINAALAKPHSSVRNSQGRYISFLNFRRD
jgi:hypothetical protein